MPVDTATEEPATLHIERSISPKKKKKKLDFGFLESVPPLPGIYRIFNQDSNLIYVGKAKNLKRRLSQYKNAKRCKKHRKMIKIIQEAASVQFEVCPSEFEAELLETQLIQNLRPKWNTAGAFYFLYPMIGVRVVNGNTYFCYSNQPESILDFKWFGAFRSREITLEAFFAIVKLLRFVGHPIPKKQLSPFSVPKYSYLYGFRQIDLEWIEQFKEFLRGKSKFALESLILNLVENAGAREKTAEIQEKINCLSRFWRHEATQLAKVIEKTQYEYYPVKQTDRDVIFLKARFANRLEHQFQNE